MANAKTASKTGTGSTSKKVTIAEMRDRLNKITDSYNELVTVHSCKTKRLESIEAAAMLIGRTVEQNPFLANGFYEPLVKMIIGLPCMELTPESVTKSVKELKTVYSLNRAQQARWMRAQVDIDGKPIYTENEIAAIGDSKDLDPEKITAAFYVLKEAILGANYESLEEYTAFYGPKYASMFTLFLRSPSKYIDIIYEHGVNMCLDVLEHNMINNTDVDYVSNPGSMVNQNLDVNGPGFVKQPETFATTRPVFTEPKLPFFNIAKAEGVFTVPDLIIPLEERMEGRKEILKEMQALEEASGKQPETSWHSPGHDGDSLNFTRTAEEINKEPQLRSEVKLKDFTSHAVASSLVPKSDELAIQPPPPPECLNPPQPFMGVLDFSDQDSRIGQACVEIPILSNESKTLIDNTRKQVKEECTKEIKATAQAIVDKTNPPEPLIKGVHLKTTATAEHIKAYLETEDLLTERFCALNTNPFNFFVCSVLESALNMLQEHRNKYMTSEFGENKNMRTNSPGNETPINTESAWFKADADTVMRKIEAVFADKKKGKKKDKKKGKKKNK